MSRRLVESLERALAGAAQNAPRDASVMVQFAAGDYAEIREALAEARAALPDVETVASGGEGTTQEPGEQTAAPEQTTTSRRRPR